MSRAYLVNVASDHGSRGFTVTIRDPDVGLTGSGVHFSPTTYSRTYTLLSMGAIQSSDSYGDSPATAGGKHASKRGRNCYTSSNSDRDFLVFWGVLL